MGGLLYSPSATSNLGVSHCECTPNGFFYQKGPVCSTTPYRAENTWTQVWAAPTCGVARQYCDSSKYCRIRVALVGNSPIQNFLRNQNKNRRLIFFVGVFLPHHRNTQHFFCFAVRLCSSRSTALIEHTNGPMGHSPLVECGGRLIPGLGARGYSSIPPIPPYWSSKAPS